MSVVFEKTKLLTDKPFHYCPGCNHGIIHRLVAESIDELVQEGKLEAGNVMGVAPVGCSVFAYDYFNCDMYEAAHGRAPAVATGAKRAVINSIYIDTESLTVHNAELQKSYKAARENEQMWECYKTDDAEVVVTAFGTVARVVKTVVDEMRAEGVKVGLFRPITVWPFPYDALRETAVRPQVKGVLDVEVNEGQMLEDVKLAINGGKDVRFFGHLGSQFPTTDEIKAEILKIKEGK